MTIVVVQHRRFPKAMLTRVKQALINVGASVIGCILNNTDTRSDQYYEYYTSYYSYYQPKSPVDNPPKEIGTAEKEMKTATVDVGKTTSGDY
jgi:hypothetical protein